MQLLLTLCCFRIPVYHSVSVMVIVQKMFTSGMEMVTNKSSPDLAPFLADLYNNEHGVEVTKTKFSYTVLFTQHVNIVLSACHCTYST